MLKFSFSPETVLEAAPESERWNPVVSPDLRMERAIRASELSYRRLFEAAKDGILILDVDTGRIDDVNPFLVKLLGFSRDEMIGHTVGELSPFKDRESNQAMLERLQAHGYVRYEDLPLETRDGRRIAVEFVSNVWIYWRSTRFVSCPWTPFKKPTAATPVCQGGGTGKQRDKIGGETMSEQTRATHPIYNLPPTEIAGFDSLAELALDLRWSWNHATDQVWRQLDPGLWEFTHNPWVVLQTVSRDQIERVLADPAFRMKAMLWQINNHNHGLKSAWSVWGSWGAIWC